MATLIYFAKDKYENGAIPVLITQDKYDRDAVKVFPT